MLKIGLTGGIGSGKTTVANYFAELNVPIIDTDKIARDVIVTNKLVFEKIVTHFGNEVLTADAQLDRKKLGEKVFANDEDRRWLEELLHPLIRLAVGQQVASLSAIYCILVIPLLVEKLPNPMVDRILVVDTTEEQQIMRTQQRDQLPLERVHAIMQAQATRAERLAAAHNIIHNDGNLTHLREQVRRLHDYYLLLANAQRVDFI